MGQAQLSSGVLCVGSSSSSSSSRLPSEGGWGRSQQQPGVRLLGSRARQDREEVGGEVDG